MSGEKKRTGGRRRAGQQSAAGFSLLETVIAIAVAFIGTTIALQFLMVRTGSVLLQERKQQAEEAAENGLNALAARSVQELPDGTGTFQIQADGTIQITAPCAPAACDLVTNPPPPFAERNSLASGYLFTASGTAPSGSKLLFVRRWRVDTIDVARQQRRITVAVVPNSTATQPLAVRSVEVTSKSR